MTWYSYHLFTIKNCTTRGHPFGKPLVYRLLSSPLVRSDPGAHGRLRSRHRDGPRRQCGATGKNAAKAPLIDIHILVFRCCGYCAYRNQSTLQFLVIFQTNIQCKWVCSLPENFSKYGKDFGDCKVTLLEYIRLRIISIRCLGECIFWEFCPNGAVFILKM